MKNTSNDMRRWMQLCEFITDFNSKSNDEPYMTWHIIDKTTATIDRFDVPKDQRGQGIGTAYYRDWESKLPVTIKIIKLWAKNSNAMRFWLKMGYISKYNNQDIDKDGIYLEKQIRR